MHHQRFAGLQGAVLEDIGEDGENRLRQAGRLYEIQALGQGQRMPGVTDRVFRIAAAPEQGAHLVARLPATGARHDLAGHFKSHGVRRAGRRRIAAQPLQNVRPVDPCGAHADQDLAVAGNGPGDLDGLQRLGRAPAALDGDRGHHLSHLRPGSGELALGRGEGLDSAPTGNRKGRPVMEEPAEIRIGRGQRLLEAIREDLELYGVAELEERIDVLRSEIARVEAKINRKRAGRAAADALFGTPT